MLWNEASQVQGYRWIDILFTFVTAYNKTPHAAHNKSPYEAFFGFKMCSVYSTPGETITKTMENNGQVRVMQEENVRVMQEEENVGVMQEEEDNGQVEDVNNISQEKEDNGQVRRVDNTLSEIITV